MCCDGNCLFFVNMRICSLIFGWISAVITGIATLGFFITDSIFMFNAIFLNSGMYPSSDLLIIVFTWLLVNVAVGFAASVFLLVGISKNKPTYLKGYMIYGMVHIFLYTIQYIILEAMSIVYYPAVRMVFLSGIAIYVCILCMLFKTHKMMTTTPNVFLNPPQQV